LNFKSTTIQQKTTNIIKPGQPIPRPLPSEGAVFLVDKPLGWSSFDALSKVRWRLSRWEDVKRIKIGHAGTLDPLATGLLVFCVKKYTKRISEFQADVKEYTGTIAFGATTPGYDLEMPPDTFFPTEHITQALLDDAKKAFIGKIQQRPPLYSAIKKDGKRLYELAREGVEMEVKARSTEIFEFELQLNPDTTHLPNEHLHFPGKKVRLDRHVDAENVLFCNFRVVCSKGTYIRSLAYDLGKAVGSGAYLSALRRTKSGAFSAEDAWTVDALTEALDLGDD